MADTPFKARTGLEVTGDALVFGNFFATGGSIGYDTGDRLLFTNNTRIDFYVNNSNEMRLESDGDLHVDGDVIAFSTTVASDKKFKDDIQTLSSASSTVKQLRGVSFIWNTGNRKGQKDIGLIAQEVETVVPEVVQDKEFLNGETAKTVDYEKLVALLIESNKELQQRIESLEEKLDGLTK